MNLIGACISATADSAPPPFADPSNLLTIIEPISVVCLKDSA